MKAFIQLELMLVILLAGICVNLFTQGIRQLISVQHIDSELASFMANAWQLTPCFQAHLACTQAIFRLQAITPALPFTVSGHRLALHARQTQVMIDV